MCIRFSMSDGVISSNHGSEGIQPICWIGHWIHWWYSWGKRSQIPVSKWGIQPAIVQCELTSFRGMQACANIARAAGWRFWRRATNSSVDRYIQTPMLWNCKDTFRPSLPILEEKSLMRLSTARLRICESSREVEVLSTMSRRRASWSDSQDGNELPSWSAAEIPILINGGRMPFRISSWCNWTTVWMPRNSDIHSAGPSSSNSRKLLGLGPLITIKEQDNDPNKKREWQFSWLTFGNNLVAIRKPACECFSACSR